jgi:hypothetical protein
MEFKPGQKKETPPPGAGQRVFYESLYKERPSSLIALNYMVAYGVLPAAECEKAAARLEKLKAAHKDQLATHTPVYPAAVKDKHEAKPEEQGHEVKASRSEGKSEGAPTPLKPQIKKRRMSKETGDETPAIEHD